MVDRFGMPAETAVQIVDRDGNLLIQMARSGAPGIPVQRWLGASLDADDVANRLTIDGALIAVTGAPATGIRIAVRLRSIDCGSTLTISFLPRWG